MLISSWIRVFVQVIATSHLVQKMFVAVHAALPRFSVLTVHGPKPVAKKLDDV
jgi:hypothetical protein